MIDFSNCKMSGEVYDGSQTNLGIIYNDFNCILKIHDEVKDKEKNKEFNESNYRNNTISEFIACKIIKEVIHYPVQDVFLGKYKFEDKDRDVIVCKDFKGPTESYTSFNNFITINLNTQNQYDKRMSLSIQQTIEFIRKIQKEFDVIDDIEQYFWDVFIIDTLIGNYDRHGNNWGFITNNVNRQRRCSPIYDCGSSLCGAVDNVDIRDILNNYSPEKLNAELDDINFTAFLRPNLDRKMTYKEFYSNKYYLNYNKFTSAINNIYPRIDLPAIRKLVDQLNIESVYISKDLIEARKQFIKNIIACKYDYILAPVYKELNNKSNNTLRKLMSCYKYNVKDDKIVNIFKESIDTKFGQEHWQKFKDKLDKNDCLTQDNTKYIIDNSFIKENSIYLYAYNIESEDNAKYLIKKYLGDNKYER